MKNLLTWLKGKKTYLLAALGALVAFAHFAGWLDSEAAGTLLVLLGFGTGAALRAGVAKK